MIIVLCIGAFAMPVNAAKDEDGNKAGAAGSSGGNQGQPQTTKGITGAAENPAEPRQETVREEIRIENQVGSATGNQAQNRTENRQENQGEIKHVSSSAGQNISIIRKNREEMNATIQSQGSSGTQRNANQNEVRLAVHTLLAMENITGGIGPQVSLIARDFNNSAQATWQYEVRIQNRDAFSRFFFGGDRTAAGEVTNLTYQNQNRIRQIEQLLNTGTLDAETKTLLQEQLQIMQQENTRLNQIASSEQQNRGLFGGFF